MPRYDNYPEDIRQYDHDPRSPFYDDSTELFTEQVANEITVGLVSGINAHGTNWDDVLDYLDDEEFIDLTQELVVRCYKGPVTDADLSPIISKLTARIDDRIQTLAEQVVKSMADDVDPDD